MCRKSKQIAFLPGPVEPPSGEGSPLEVKALVYLPLKPMASLADVMLDRRKIESKKQRAIRSWLNALCSSGRRWNSSQGQLVKSKRMRRQLVDAQTRRNLICRLFQIWPPCSRRLVKVSSFCLVKPHELFCALCRNWVLAVILWSAQPANEQKTLGSILFTTKHFSSVPVIVKCQIKEFK